MVDRLARLAGRASPAVSVALLVMAADWAFMASLYTAFPLAGVLLGAGLAAALLAITIACYTAVRVLLRAG